MLIGGSLKFKAELPRDVVSNLISYALRNCAEVAANARNWKWSPETNSPNSLQTISKHLKAHSANHQSCDISGSCAFALQAPATCQTCDVIWTLFIMNTGGFCLLKFTDKKEVHSDNFLKWKCSSGRELAVPVGMRSERFDKRLPEDGLPAQTRLLLPVSPYSMCHYYHCENSQVFSLEGADIECWWKSFPLRLWPQLTHQDLWWVSTLLLTSLIPFTKIPDGWAHSLSIVITGITHQNLWLVSMFLIDSTH